MEWEGEGRGAGDKGWRGIGGGKKNKVTEYWAEIGRK